MKIIFKFGEQIVFKKMYFSSVINKFKKNSSVSSDQLRNIKEK